MTLTFPPLRAIRIRRAGSSFGSILGLVGKEALIGLVYATLGYALIRGTEVVSPRWATLERA